MKNPSRHLATLALLGALAVPLPAMAGAPEPPEGTPEQRETVNTLRNVGTAMFVWYEDQVKRQGIEKPGKDKAYPSSSPGQVDVAAVPVISVKELEKVLVPRYIRSIPEKDGWGHPVEYRLNTSDLKARQIMAIRSGGADGQLAGTSYEVGGFPPDQADADYVWIDGFFARWPQVPAKTDGATR